MNEPEVDAETAAEQQAAAMDAEIKAAEAFDQADSQWLGELEFGAFISAFRSDPSFVRKVAKAADLPVDLLKRMGDDQLEAFFDELDTDYSGTISFDEFIDGLIRIRMQ